MIFSILYEFLYSIAFLCFLPKMVYQMFKTGKYRKSFFKKLGFSLPQFEKKRGSPLFWIHAVSVGETNAVSAVVKELKAQSPTAQFIISSGTETGHETAKRVMPFADVHLYLPFDFYFSVRRVLSRFQPDVVVLAEGDYWWRFLDMAKKKGAAITVVSAKLSERSYNRMKVVSFFPKRLFALVDYFSVQDEAYKTRFQDLGVPSSQISVEGNIKSDVSYAILQADERAELLQKFNFSPNDFILVAGSTHHPEEEIIISAVKQLLEKDPSFKLMLIPRHTDRCKDLKTYLTSLNIPWSSWSEPAREASPKIVLVDQMGVLIKCYQIASSAIVCGSFTSKVGGHNILEPIFFGVPTLCGPHMHTQMDLLQSAEKYGAIIQATAENLGDHIQTLIQDQKKREDMKKNSLYMMSQLKGATKRCVRNIARVVPDYFQLSEKSV